MVIDFVNKIKEVYGTIAGKILISSSNVLAPIILVCFIACPACFITATYNKDDLYIKYILIIAGILPILIGCGSFVYFALRQPEKLQSEQYQIWYGAKQMMMEKGKGKVEYTADIIQSFIPNPYADKKKIEDHKEEK